MIKKLSLYIFILIALGGIFIGGLITNAQSPDGKGTCYDPNVIFPEKDKPTTLNEAQCKLNGATLTKKAYYWMPTGATKPNCIYDSKGTPTNVPCTADAEHTPVKCDPPLVVKDNKCVPATPAETPKDPKYYLLAPLPCEQGSSEGCVRNADGSYTLNNFDPTGAGGAGIGNYLNIMIRIFIGICAVLAVVMIVMGGLEWMTSGLASSKEAGKERIWGAVMGLLLALGSWLLLNTINPNLLNTELKSLKGVEVVVDLGGEGTAPFVARTPQALQSIGITCGGSGGSTSLIGIAQSFVGRSTYSMEQRNTISGGKAFVDCSSYVSQVYACAGLGNPGGTTAGIFGGGSIIVNSISSDGTLVNGVALKPGDLLGWKQGENKEKWGHVVMYIGNGQVIDAQKPGVGVRFLNSDQFKGRIKYIKKI